jgi:hypothetical protein
MPRTDAEVRALVDEGIRLEARIDPLSDRLKEIKADLRAVGKERKSHLLEGLLGSATIKDDKDTTITYEALTTYLKKHKQMGILDKLVKVVVGAARKELGEAAMKDIASEVPKPYAKCELTAIPGLVLSELVDLDLAKVSEVLKVVEAAKIRVEAEEANKAAQKKTKRGKGTAASVAA